MDIRELKYFAQIAKDGSFSTAAAKLSISQPALSKVIQKMEDQLGVSLFYTFQRRQKLTDAGAILLEHALRVINGYDSIVESTHLDKTFYQGQVCVGFPPIAGICYFSEFIISFSKLYPGIKVSILEAGSQDILDAVDSGGLDLGCVSAPIPEDKFDHARFVKDDFLLAVSSQHPLACKDHVTFDELKNENFILSSSSYHSHQIVRFACRESGFEPQVSVESNRWDFTAQMVRLNYGISVLPSSIFKRFSFPDIHLLQIAHPAMRHHLELITKKDGYVSYAVNCFISHVMQRMEADPDASSLVSPVARRID